VGALRVVRWSAHYDQTVIFYRDIVGLPVLETFRDSYRLDGTIVGLPGGPVHLEIVRLTDARHPPPGFDQVVFYLPDAAAQEQITARLAAAGLDPASRSAARCRSLQGAVDNAGTADLTANTKVIATYTASQLAAAASPCRSKPATAASCALRCTTPQAPVGLSNPAWLLRTARPRGIPARRSC
jgi:hypothetical protein